MSRAMGWAVLGLTLLSGCIQRLDVEQKIVLVPGENFTQPQEQVLALAAESWNLEFGTHLVVSREPATGEQVVPVRMSRFVCAYLDGITVTAGEMEVQLCELIGDNPKRLAGTTMHELGHVLGIDEHASASHAMMSLGESDQRYFTEADHDLFYGAHPGFQGGGDLVRKLASSESRGALAQPEGESPFMLWAEDGCLRFAELDPFLARPHGRTGRIATQGYVTWIRTAPVSDGFFVVWREIGDRFFASRVRLPSAEAGAPFQLQLNSSGFDLDITALSVVHIEGDLYLGVGEGLGADARYWVFRQDARTGAARTFQLQMVAGAAQIMALENALFLAQPTCSSLELAKLDREGQVVDRVSRDCARWVEVHENLAAVAHGGRLFVAGNLDDSRRFYLAQVVDMDVRQWIEFEAPDGVSAFDDLTLAATPSGAIALALSRHGLLGDEIYLGLFDAASLKWVQEWRRVSAADLSKSVQPWLAAAEDRLLVLWRDVQGDDPMTEVKARSVHP